MQRAFWRWCSGSSARSATRCGMSGGGRPPLVPAAAFVVILLAQSGCALTTGTGVTDEGCSLYEPISWSVLDSDRTIRQIKEHNAVWTALCRSRSSTVQPN